MNFPQNNYRVWGKVMFLHACVILFMGERGWLSSMHHRSHDQHPGGGVGFPAYITGHMASIQGVGLHSGGSVSGGSTYRGVGQTPPQTRNVGCTHPTGMLSYFTYKY